MSDDLILESRNEALASKCKVITFTLTTFESNLINETFEINVCDISVLSSSVCNINLTSILLTNSVDLVIYIFA